MTVKYTNRAIAFVIAVVLLWPVAAAAATIQSGDAITTAKGNSIADNFYVAGGNLSLGSTVNGDLYGAGGNVLVTGPVANDIVVGGGSVTILGDSGGDVRVAGGNVLVANSIAGELIALGGSVTVSPNTTIEKDVTMAGGQLSLNGNTLGNVAITGGTATIDGHIHGNVVAEVDSLTLGPDAVVDGNLLYRAKSADALTVNNDAVIGGQTVFKQIEAPSPTPAKTENAVLAFLSAFFLYKLLTLVIVALVLTWLFPRFSHAVTSSALHEPLRMLGYGFVALVVTPVAAVLLLVTLLGIPLGIIVFLSYGLLLLVANIYGGVVLGVWLGQLMHQDRSGVTVTWKQVVGGVLLLTLITLIPVVGWLVGLGVLLVTIGAVTLIIRDQLWTRR